jgi:selenocysteine lyase/cysteine desulfurase
VVSLVHMSNVLGTINPVAEIAKKAKAAGRWWWWTGPRAPLTFPWT